MSPFKSFFQFIIRWGFHVGMVSFLLISLLAIYNSARFHEYSSWVTHTNEVLGQINELAGLVDRTESSQRGYFLTHNPKILDLYRTSAGEIGGKFVTLKRLVADNPEQSHRAATLEQQILERIESMESVVENPPQLYPEDWAARLNPQGMQAVHESIDEFINEERRLLKVRNDNAERSSRQSVYFIFIGAAMALLSIVISRLSLKNALQAHVDQSILLESIFTSMGDGLLVVDQGGKVTHFNQAAKVLMGTEIKKTMGVGKLRAGWMINAPDVGKPQSLDESPLARALKGESVDGHEFVTPTGPEGRRTLSVDTRPVAGADGSRIGALALFRDVTRQKSVQEEWKQAREAALEASRLKSDFLATMSHEIRTPMNGVIGMSTLLLDTNLNPDQSSYVKTIKSSADALLTLINQILDHAKIESGKLDLHNADFNMQECVDNVLSMLRYLARSKKVELEATIDPRVPEFVRGDAARVRQVLINLIGNALKFTEKGFVKLNISARPSPEGQHVVYFEVQDSGPGIAPELLPKLFEKFSQVHSQGTTKTAGSGLGLMISRELVHLMGGEVGVESVVNQGSKFWFTACFQVAQAKVHEPTSQKHPRQSFHGRVLVAEDQPINQTVIRKYLQMFSLTCEVVSDGEKAVEMVKLSNFDLILMDCQMPTLDGYEATKQIREWEKSLDSRHIPIVALTAEGRSGDRDRCFSVGMDEFLTKPIELARLQAILAEFLESKNSEEEFSLPTLDKLAAYDSGGSPLVLELIEEFLLSGPTVLEHFASAAESANLDSLRFQSHALRSSSLTLGLVELARLCEQMENDPAAEKFAALRDSWDRGCAWLRDYAQKKRATGRVA